MSYLSESLLFVDIGAYSTKLAFAKVSSEPEVVQTKGFDGGVSDVDALADTLFAGLSKLLSKYRVQDTAFDVVIATNFHNSVFCTEEHEVSCADSSEVLDEHMRKLEEELKKKILLSKRSSLMFFDISEYRIRDSSRERRVINPRGLSADAVKGRAVAVHVSSSSVRDVLNVLSTFNRKYPDLSLRLLRFSDFVVLDSSVMSAYGSLPPEELDEYVHVDLGHTSTRVMRVVGGKLLDYTKIPKGGGDILSQIRSLGFRNREALQVLRGVLEGRSEVTVAGRTVSARLVIDILRRSLREDIFKSSKLSHVVGRASTASLSGSMANSKLLRDMVSDALRIPVVEIPDEDASFAALRGMKRFVSSIRKNGLVKPRVRGKGILRRIVDFFEREILGK